MRKLELSQDDARRLACASSGFDRGRPAAAPDRRHFRRVMERLHILQLDFVNVLVPAHQLVMWSRLGAYDRDRFHRFVYGNGGYTEHWAHEACIVPARYWPVLAYRREAYRPWKSSPASRLPDRHSRLADLLARIREDGPLTTSDFTPVGKTVRRPGEWHRSPTRHLLEELFGTGELSVANRTQGFRRAYDLPERVLPEHHHLPPVTAADAHRQLLRDAAEALGVATVADLADYFRLPVPVARPRIEELAAGGELRAVRVDGWRETAYVPSAVRLPRSIEGASLVSPFDPLVWARPRLARLFGFDYKLEIYTPAAKRRWGYYVLPFRLGSSLVARVDLKADRERVRLLVRRAYAEDRVEWEEVLDALAGELIALASWLSLDDVRVARHNAFAKALASQCRHRLATA